MYIEVVFWRRFAFENINYKYSKTIFLFVALVVSPDSPNEYVGHDRSEYILHFDYIIVQTI